MRSAAALGTRDASVLFEHLYTYNSLPLTESRARRFADVEGVREELGLRADGELASLLARHWVSLPGEVDNGWLTWVRPTRFERLAGATSAVELKLYLSPTMEALPTAFRVLAETLSHSHATAFKVGADAVGLLRPDKLMAYFATLADLIQSAHQLADRLTDVPAQGVPFTAEIAGEGLLSWGIDPPERAKVLGKATPSWREWVCYQLAVALAEAGEGEDGPEPLWQQALERLRETGVEVERWLPPAASWVSALR